MEAERAEAPLSKATGHGCDGVIKVAFAIFPTAVTRLIKDMKERAA
jgi:dihydrodipicolinate synthase/N-acetylneuraminate lyase